MDWISGPDAMAQIDAWCAEQGTTPGRLGARCTPTVYRSTFQRWRAGANPDRGTWVRLLVAMAASPVEQTLDELLGGVA